MSKKQLIEFGLIAIAIIVLFKAIESFIGLVLEVAYGFDNGFERYSTAIKINVLFIVIYLAIFFLFIKKRNVIADLISETPAGLEENAEMGPVININQQQLLYIIFIVLAVISLISSVTGIIEYIIQNFNDQLSRSADVVPSTGYGNFKSDIIKFIIALVVILTAKPLSDYFSKRNHQTPSLEFQKEEN